MSVRGLRCLVDFLIAPYFGLLAVTCVADMHSAPILFQHCSKCISSFQAIPDSSLSSQTYIQSTRWCWPYLQNITSSFQNNNRKMDLPRDQQLHLSQRNEDFFSWRNLYTNVHSSYICKSPSLETTQRSFQGWVVKWPMVHPYCRILLGNEQELTIDTSDSLDDSLRNDAEWKSQPQKDPSCMIPFMETVYRLVVVKVRNGRGGVWL